MHNCLRVDIDPSVRKLDKNVFKQFVIETIDNNSRAKLLSDTDYSPFYLLLHK